jgi:hypothetical protein
MQGENYAMKIRKERHVPSKRIFSKTKANSRNSRPPHVARIYGEIDTTENHTASLNSAITQGNIPENAQGN